MYTNNIYYATHLGVLGSHVHTPVYRSDRLRVVVVQSCSDAARKKAVRIKDEGRILLQRQIP